MTEVTQSPFNSALETGIRALTILTASFPKAHDLSRLVQYDYLTVHSADADGPPSLHPPLPLRSGELLVRRGLVESGLRLMMSRSLVDRRLHQDGLFYIANEAAGAFLDNMQSVYITELRKRAEWVAARFDDLNSEDVDAIVNRVFQAWTVEFQPLQLGSQAELL